MSDGILHLPQPELQPEPEPEPHSEHLECIDSGRNPEVPTAHADMEVEICSFKSGGRFDYNIAHYFLCYFVIIINFRNTFKISKRDICERTDA